MSAAAAAWQRLSVAMLVDSPACQGDDRFTLDDQPAASLAYKCESCVLLDLCREYAQLARPAAGIWAGKRWARKTYNKHTETTDTKETRN